MPVELYQLIWEFRTGSRSAPPTPLQRSRRPSPAESRWTCFSCLSNDGGRLVLREEILEHAWGKDVFVDVDTSIGYGRARKIRQALKDNPDSPVFLATVPSKGYRFVAPVDQVVTAAPSAAPAIERALEPSASRPSAVKWSGRWKILLAATGLGLFIALTGFFRFTAAAYALSEQDTIVLADFTNTTGDVIFDDALREWSSRTVSPIALPYSSLGRAGSADSSHDETSARYAPDSADCS